MAMAIPPPSALAKVVAVAAWAMRHRMHMPSPGPDGRPALAVVAPDDHLYSLVTTFPRPPGPEPPHQNTFQFPAPTLGSVYKTSYMTPKTTAILASPAAHDMYRYPEPTDRRVWQSWIRRHCTGDIRLPPKWLDGSEFVNEVSRLTLRERPSFDLRRAGQPSIGRGSTADVTLSVFV